MQPFPVVDSALATTSKISLPSSFNSSFFPHIFIYVYISEWPATSFLFYISRTRPVHTFSALNKQRRDSVYPIEWKLHTTSDPQVWVGQDLLVGKNKIRHYHHVFFLFPPFYPAIILSYTFTQYLCFAYIQKMQQFNNPVSSSSVWVCVSVYSFVMRSQEASVSRIVLPLCACTM